MKIGWLLLLKILIQNALSQEDCGVPTAGTGYLLGFGSTTYGSTFSMTCDTGYLGSASWITCQAGGTWTSSSGCVIVDCGAPSQTGYSFTVSSTTYDSSSIAQVCDTGYSGTASAITCQTDELERLRYRGLRNSCSRHRLSSGLRLHYVVEETVNE
jgi:hypothetical protein